MGVGGCVYVEDAEAAHVSVTYGRDCPVGVSAYVEVNV